MFIFNKLIEREEINFNKSDVLFNICYNCDTNKLKLLLTRKDLNVNLQDRDGITVLFIAVIRNNMNMFKILLERKDINVNIQDKEGKTILMNIDKNNISLSKILLERKDINVNLRDVKGYNALIYACKNFNTRYINLLLERKDLEIISCKNSKEIYGRYRHLIRKKYLQNKYKIQKLYYIARRDFDESVLGTLPREIFKVILDYIYPPIN